jgi:hypothetical protein
MVVIGVRLQRGRRRLLIRTMLPQPNSCPCSAGTSLLGDGGCWQSSVGEACLIVTPPQPNDQDPEHRRT